jgi:hypothetical protein
VEVVIAAGKSDGGGGGVFKVSSGHLCGSDGFGLFRGGANKSVLQDLQEEELLALSQQIGNHMESMKSNLGQIEGVLPAVAKARAALQGTLCEYLEPEQYEQVLLG